MKKEKCFYFLKNIFRNRNRFPEKEKVRESAHSSFVYFREKV